MPATEITLDISAAMTVEEYGNNADAVKGQLRAQLGCHEPFCLLAVQVTAGSLNLTVVATDRAPNSTVQSAAASMGTADLPTLSAALGISLIQLPKVRQVRAVTRNVVLHAPSPPPPSPPLSPPPSPSPSPPPPPSCNSGTTACGVDVWCDSTTSQLEDVGQGYYSPDEDCSRSSCTSMDSEVYAYIGSPSYTASGGGVNQCPWGCGGGFYDGGAGFMMWTSLGQAWMIMCLEVGVGECSPPGSNAVSQW